MKVRDIIKLSSKMGGIREEVEQNMLEAMEFHVDGLKLEGLEIPQPTTSSAYVEVAA